MPLDDATRAKLVELLARFGADGVRELADELLSLVGDAAATAASSQARASADPQPRPDTDWQPAQPVDDCPGSRRWCRGRLLVVRKCHQDGSRPRWRERRGADWYATADGTLLIDTNLRQWFFSEEEARAAADAFEPAPYMDCSGNSVAI